jgi:phosphotransferase system enzyme I (PtsI)
MRGIGASQGIAIATAYIKANRIKPEKRISDNAEAEEKRFYAAMGKSKEQLEAMIERTRKKIGPEEAQIFEAHIMILEDPELLDKVLKKIRQDKADAPWAVHEAVEELSQLFAAIEDQYIRERVVDLQDVGLRLTENLLGIQDADYSDIKEAVILVAEELTPSDMSKLPPDKVLGILTEAGGPTSHTAIMSRVMGLPAVVGAAGVLQQVREADLLAINGTTGEVYINPSYELLAPLQRERDFEQEQQRSLTQYMGQKTSSKDGYEIHIGCNIGTPKDLEAVLKNDGEGIGLFRSEFLYMNRNTMPSEEEQFRAYKEAAETMRGKPVILRTLDIGGDKQLSYMDFPKEDNPFLGYRAIRYCLEETDSFRIQLRALLRASAFGNVKIMLPMIGSVDEVRAAKAQLHRAMEELQERKLTYNPKVEVGIMIETPAAAVISDKLAAEADFFSIGTNDLVQYTLAVDRMNSKIAALYTPYHPAVLQLIKLVADNANKAGIRVGMCGEAAQDELLAPVFMGMGLHELSVSPPRVLQIRKLISGINKKDMEYHVRALLKLSTAEEVQKYLQTIN